MTTASPRQRIERTRLVGAKPRRGVALVFVLVFVVAMAALAMSSIFMASNSNLLAKSYNRERDLKYAAEAALAMGKARLNTDQNFITGIPVTSLYRTLFPAPATLNGADKLPVPGVTVQVYVGPTGSTSGQNGRFVSIVATATDVFHPGGFIRRLELTQESFAKFAYWSNSESNNGATIFFNNGDQLFGPVWSNDVISIGTLGATFHDNVGTAMTINGKANGTFIKVPQENQKPILLPSTASLANLSAYASQANWNFTSSDGPISDEAQVLDRIEFLAADIKTHKDSIQDDQGFFRVFRGNIGNEMLVRGDWPVPWSSSVSASQMALCGDWHYMPPKSPNDTFPKFYPIGVHNTTWFRQQAESAYVKRGSWPGYTSAHNKALADSAQGIDVGAVLSNPRARCYLAGDPHLVAVDRVVGQVPPLPQSPYLPADVHKGGEDTTFTPVGQFGSWLAVAATPLNDTIAKYRPWDGRYLNGVSRLYTANAKGVVYFTGNVGVSGTVNGLITLYAKGDIVILDDIRYANDPATGVCHDILGLISDLDVVAADNAVNTPQVIYPGGTSTNVSLDDTKDLFIHSVIMALGTSFRVENFGGGPTAVNNCDAFVNGRGCIYLSGGLIQQSRGPVGTSNGSGFSKRYTYDHCATITPPPYFPTTGRFQDNRYLELDPQGFNAQRYFKSLTP